MRPGWIQRCLKVAIGILVIATWLSTIENDRTVWPKQISSPSPSFEQLRSYVSVTLLESCTPKQLASRFGVGTGNILNVNEETLPNIEEETVLPLGTVLKIFLE